MVRPQSINYKNEQFMLLKNNGKYMAKCEICLKILTNTARSRLLIHRKRCSRENINGSNESHSQYATSDRSRSTVEIIHLDEITEIPNDGIVIAEANEHGTCEISKNSFAAQATTAVVGRTTSTSSISGKVSIKTTKNSSIKQFIDSVTEKDKTEFNLVVAKFFFGSNISFNTIESKHFQKLIETLRPSYAKHVPSRKLLATTLLDAVYNDCLKQIKNLRDRPSVLLIDGWKNTSSNTKITVTMLHNANGDRAFLNACDVESETADNLADVVYESIDLAKSNYNTDVYAIVSDNASNMVRMGKNLDHVLWHSTCNSHIGNLFAGDVVDVDLLKQVTGILKEFKRDILEKYLLKYGGSRIKLPPATRWCYQRDSLECFLKNLQYMKKVMIKESLPKHLKTATILKIHDDNFVDKIKHMKSILEPICKLTNICQNATTSNADAAHLWLTFKWEEDVLTTVDSSTKNKLLKHLNDRKKMALNKYTLTSYYLNPQYDNSLLSEEQMTVIDGFLVLNLDNNGVASLCEYKNQTNYFDLLYARNITKPEVFWTMASRQHKQLSTLALKLLNIPASTAQLERTFSNWGWIHSSIRNRLTFDRSKKLIHIYLALNQQNQNNFDLDADIEEV